MAGCKGKLNRKHLDRSLALGTAFMLANQRAAGNFHYELDWKTLEYTDGDSAVRQAGAAWGLALIHHDQPSDGVERALKKALRFFEKHSRKTGDGRRYVVYPSDASGRLGTVCLVALALIEYLRVKPSKKRKKQLEGYLAFIASARRPEGRFRASYDHDDGSTRGAPSSYFDGEALLALTKAARHLGMKKWRAVAIREADAGYRANVVEALEEDEDSAVTKGYYQWASMAYFELATWPGLDGARHKERLWSLADWMIGVHRTLSRTRNTGYAYEGINLAYAVAVDEGDDARAARLRKVINCGMTKLTSWQVGHPLANRFIRSRKKHDPRAMGGVQNHRKESRLRIDVAQHQMHAVILARRHVWPS